MSLEVTYRRALAAAKKLTPAAEWKTTPELVARAKQDWGRHGKWVGDVQWMPMSVLRKALYIDFRDPEQLDLDIRGGRPHIAKLAKLMREGVPLPPAIGYYDSFDRSLVLHDGNHRVAAARKARVKKFPILIYEPHRSGH